MPLPTMLVGLALQGVNMIMANQARKKEEIRKNNLNTELQGLRNNRQDVVNVYENMTNPYDNMQVATQAAEMQQEQTDMQLANTLDAMMQMNQGGGAGAATLLAQQALKSQQAISAGIEEQEKSNADAQAKTQFEVDKLIASGESRAWSRQETREKQELDRMQSQFDEARLQEQEYQNAIREGAFGMANTALGGADDFTRDWDSMEKKDTSDAWTEYHSANPDKSYKEWYKKIRNK